MLKESLHQVSDKPATVLIEEWAASIRFQNTSNGKKVPISEVIAAHRNIFRSAQRPEILTSTQKFIQDLKKLAETLEDPETAEVSKVSLT